MASIVIASGDRRGNRYFLGRRTNVIGRAESLPIQILDDSVSRKHVQIHFDPATRRYSMLDMSSRNGVFLNGARMTAETLLRHCDRIRIGQTELLFSERDLAESTVMLHRFNKPGERQRLTQIYWPCEAVAVQA
jgi:pSer/pThr/pTyr-binding forkhead associated (FHA) protein